MRPHQLNTSEQSHVAGASLAQEHIAPLLAALPGSIPDPGEVVLLDFSGIEAATASYIKATVVRLLREGQDSADGGAGRNIFVAVAAVSPEVAEELDAVLTANGLACIEAVKWNESTIATGRLHGVLEHALRETLDALIAEKTASATQLYEKHQRSIPISPTGWNNRLTQLHRVRLARRTRHGRQWRYEPIVAEVLRG